MSPAEKSAVVADHKKEEKRVEKSEKNGSRMKRLVTLESSNATENKKEATLALASHEQKKITNH